MPDESKTIEELENNRWPDPDPKDTGLIKTCYILRKKRLRDFTPNDMRILIGQRMNLGLMIPKAVTILESDPLIEADTYYPGNLLESVLRLSKTREFWDTNPDWVQRGVAMAHRTLVTLEQLKPDDHISMTNDIKNALTSTIRQFLDRYDTK